MAGVWAILIAALSSAAHAAPRVFSLDQCADQYVLSLVPRADIAALSFRADDADSYLRARARGLPQRRASLEAVLASGAGVAVRYWGGDEAMVRRLRARGVEVVRIDEADDFEGVRANLRKVAAALGAAAKGEVLIRRMDAELAEAKGAWGGRRALYLTPGGFTAGSDTLVGAMMAGAGMKPAVASPGYAPVSLERLVADPPDAVVLGFFDRASMGTQAFAPGRNRALQARIRGRVVASLPAAILGCPAWFAADGARDLARAARGR